MRYHETCTPRTHISYTYTCIQRYPVPAIFGSLLHSWCCRCFCPHICVCVICVCVSVFISLSLEDMYSLSLSLSLPLSLSLSFSLPLSLSLSLYLPLSLKFNQKWTRPRLEPTLLYQSAQSALILLQVHTQMCVCTWRAPRSGSSLSLQLPARKLPAARQGHVRRWAWITAARLPRQDAHRMAFFRLITHMPQCGRPAAPGRGRTEPPRRLCAAAHCQACQ